MDAVSEIGFLAVLPFSPAFPPQSLQNRLHSPLLPSFRPPYLQDYLYRQNSAVVHSPTLSLSPTGRAREERYNSRKAERDEFARQKKMEEDMKNKNLLILKKKAMAEERYATGCAASSMFHLYTTRMYRLSHT